MGNSFLVEQIMGIRICVFALFCESLISSIPQPALTLARDGKPVAVIVGDVPRELVESAAPKGAKKRAAKTFEADNDLRAVKLLVSWVGKMSSAEPKLASDAAPSGPVIFIGK